MMTSANKHYIRVVIDEAALELDKTHPGWQNDIETSKLNMSHFHSCIAGQLFGGHSVWSSENDTTSHRLKKYLEENHIIFLRDAFLPDGISYESGYMRRIWLREIRKRKLKDWWTNVKSKLIN